MSARTAVAAPPADERDRLRELLWALLLKRIAKESLWRVPGYLRGRRG